MSDTIPALLIVLITILGKSFCWILKMPLGTQRCTLHHYTVSLLTELPCCGNHSPARRGVHGRRLRRGLVRQHLPDGARLHPGPYPRLLRRIRLLRPEGPRATWAVDGPARAGRLQRPSPVRRRTGLRNDLGTSIQNPHSSRRRRCAGTGRGCSATAGPGPEPYPAAECRRSLSASNRA